LALTHEIKTIKQAQFSCKNCSHKCAYDCVQYTIQHGTVLIIFPLILQTITTAQMWYAGQELEHNLYYARDE